MLVPIVLDTVADKSTFFRGFCPAYSILCRNTMNSFSAKSRLVLHDNRVPGQHPEITGVSHVDTFGQISLNLQNGARHGRSLPRLSACKGLDPFGDIELCAVDLW
jgi:hypothetical protein